ncbi:hypothetical protein evm_013274 [Chilo suppressalis]|nr:hypothetical protein evm_013274 [Chilo suppressalis]
MAYLSEKVLVYNLLAMSHGFTRVDLRVYNFQLKFLKVVPKVRILGNKGNKRKIKANAELPLREEFLDRSEPRLKSRRPPCHTAATMLEDGFDARTQWRSDWKTTTEGTLAGKFTPGVRPAGFDLPRREWCLLNRLRTGHGLCAHYKHRCGWIDSPRCECGADVQTIQHIVQDCPLNKYDGAMEDLVSLDNDAANWLRHLDLKV